MDFMKAVNAMSGNTSDKSSNNSSNEVLDQIRKIRANLGRETPGIDLTKYAHHDLNKKNLKDYNKISEVRSYIGKALSVTDGKLYEVYNRYSRVDEVTVEGVVHGVIINEPITAAGMHNILIHYSNNVSVCMTLFFLDEGSYTDRLAKVNKSRTSGSTTNIKQQKYKVPYGYVTFNVQLLKYHTGDNIYYDYFITAEDNEA